MLVLMFPVVGVFLYVRNNICFLIQFRSVSGVTSSSSAMDSFVLCSVHDTRMPNVFP